MDKYANFTHLSVKDLIEARDQFHVHLMNKKNVIATAIGRYLIRLSDLDQDGNLKPDTSRGYVPKPKRTLGNSIVIDISWPCVLVFVEKWQDETALINEGGDNVVPKTIYMPDGRVVPVCIVEAEKKPQAVDSIDPEKLRFPDNLIGGGFPLQMHSQGVDWIATVGCVVADGHKYYALTNKHVTGDGGELVYSRFGAAKRRIGVASGRTLNKVDFDRLYDGWKSKDVLVNCDIGLVEIDDLNRWKTDIVKIGEMDELYDLNTHNIDLNMLTEHKLVGGKPTALNGQVVGYGAVTGDMEGELLALFYRYKSIGGKDYVSDFLISGRKGEDLKVHHGDSGTLWLLETRDENDKLKRQPIALHWGQHEFVEGRSRERSSYSLATCLSNVCRELDVELIRDWNLSLDYSWGKVGHYTVGTFAVEAIQYLIDSPDHTKFAKFEALMKNNLPNISFPRSGVNKHLAAKGNPELSTDPTKGFCPLADVPDIIWKQSKKKTKWGRQGDENPNHYADADAPTKKNGDLFELCDEAAKLTTARWANYYEDIDTEKIGLGDEKVSQGLISFRVWQAFDYMVDALEAKSVEKFIFAAGVLAHYVGDGCQPLHGSYMSNGDPADNEVIDYTAKRDSPAWAKHPHKKGQIYKKTINPGQGVHTAYEDAMVDDNIGEIIKSLSGILGNKDHRIRKEPRPEVNSGQDAGFSVLNLMRETQSDIHPHDIVTLFKKIKEGGGNVSSGLYEEFGTRTSECMARGCLYLASIWKAAWVVGHGDEKIDDTGTVSEDSLRKLYREPSELPSMHLDTIAPLLKNYNSGGTTRRAAARRGH